MKKYIFYLFAVIVILNTTDALCRNIIIEDQDNLTVVGPKVRVYGRQLQTDFDQDGIYDTFTIKGVGYSPVPIGRHVSDWGSNIFDDDGILNRDFALLQAMKANTIRIWKGNDTEDYTGRNKSKITTKTLNAAEQYGIKVIAGFWVDTPASGYCGSPYYPPSFLNPNDPNYLTDRNTIINNFGQYVQNFKDHPAILFWAIGNENNYSISSYYLINWYSLANQMAQKAHEVEGANYHPVAVVNGEIATLGQSQYNTTDALSPNVDIWGANIYRGTTFGTLFSEYSAKSYKPLWISEYGADSWYTSQFALRSDHFEEGVAGYSDNETQSTIDISLWDEIVKNRNIAIGGTVMEYSDEWWKPYEWIDGGTHNSTQEHFGFGKPDSNCNGVIDNGDGAPPPVPDGFFDEEWWGIMQISSNPIPFSPDVMSPRNIYYSYQTRFECKESTPYYTGPDNGKSCDGTSTCCDNPDSVSLGKACVTNCKNIKKILQY